MYKIVLWSVNTFPHKFKKLLLCIATHPNIYDYLQHEEISSQAHDLRKSVSSYDARSKAPSTKHF